MPRYAFVSRTSSGVIEKGVFEAANSDDAISILQARNLTVISIEENRNQPVTVGFNRRMHRGATHADLTVLAHSLSAMLDAGVPLLRALELVQEQATSKRLSIILREMIRDIRGGSTFRNAVARHPKIFSKFWITLIETGEASGQLSKSLEQIADYLEKAASVHRKVVSALIYPAILVFVAVGAVLIFTLKIIPTFAGLFAGLNAQLPFLTRMVIQISDFIRKHFFFVLAGVVGLWCLFIAYAKTPLGRWQVDMMSLRMPVFGPLIRTIMAERFSSDLGTLLKAGVPILHALDIVIAGCDNKVVVSVLDTIRTSVREGRSLAEPLLKTDLFPPMVAQMVAVGEQTGKLSTMLEELAKYQAEQVDTAVSRMTALLEPIMIVGMGLVIGTLVVAMYLPIFQLSSAFK